MARISVPVTLTVEMPDITGALGQLVAGQARILARLDAIERAITANTITTEALIMADFTALYDEIEPLDDAIDGAVTLLEGLSAQLVDAKDDPAEIQAIAEALNSGSTRLATAVVANTPAAPEPTPAPEPEPVEPIEG